MFKHSSNIQIAVPGSVEVFAAVIIIIIISSPYLPHEFPVKPTMIHSVNSFILGPCLKTCNGSLVLITYCFIPASGGMH